MARKPKAPKPAPEVKPEAPKLGRPPSFKPEFAAQAEKLCELGATDTELADFFGVDVRSIHRWKNEHPSFCHALKTGKELADERVQRSLYHRAIGYKQDSVKIFMPAGAEAPVYAPYVESFPPDTTAAIFWLKNRRSQDWRDRQVVEHDISDNLASRLEAARRRG